MTEYILQGRAVGRWYCEAGPTASPRNYTDNPGEDGAAQHVRQKVLPQAISDAAAGEPDAAAHRPTVGPRRRPGGLTPKDADGTLIEILRAPLGEKS